MIEYIDKAMAIAEISNKSFTMSMCVSRDECNGMRFAQNVCARTIEDIPPAIAGDEIELFCPNCNTRHIFMRIGNTRGYSAEEKTNYCPNCGAKIN